jgi:hypothetical protein
MIMKVGKWQKSGVRVTLHSVSIIAVLKIHLKHPLKLHRRSLSWVKWFFASWLGGGHKIVCMATIMILF